MKISTERHDAICYRLIRDNKILALALKLTNNSWGVYDTDDAKPLTKRSFASPRKAADWLETHLDTKTPQTSTGA